MKVDVSSEDFILKGHNSVRKSGYCTVFNTSLYQEYATDGTEFQNFNDIMFFIDPNNNMSSLIECISKAIHICLLMEFVL